MQVSQQALAYMLLCALGCGAALGALYDALSFARWGSAERYDRAKRWRERVRPPKALSLRRKQSGTTKKREWISYLILFFEDIGFCLLFSLVTVLLLYETNDGQWRTSVPVLMLVAFFGYRATLGRLIRQALACLCALLSALIAWIVALLLYPVRLTWRLTQKPRRALLTACRRLRERADAYISAQKQKRTINRQKNNPPAPQQKPVPDGRTVFARGGYHPMNEKTSIAGCSK